MNTDQFRRWLQKQTNRLKQLGEEADLSDCEEAAEIVQAARQRALDHHFPAAYEGGQIRGGPLAIGLARSVLSRMMQALPEPNPPEVTNPALRPKEIAARLGTKASTVRGWISSGKLQAANIGSKRSQFVIRESDLDAFLESHQVLTPQRRVTRQQNGFKRY